MNDVLPDTPYVAGYVVSMADITLFAGHGCAEFTRNDMLVGYTHLHNWRQRVSERPTVKAAMTG